MATDNPLLGDNLPPDPRPAIVARLGTDFAHLGNQVSEQQDKAAELPAVIETKEQHDQIADLIKDMRSTYKTVDATREAEKNPFWIAGQAVDGFFAPLKTRLEETAADLNQRVKVYLDGIAEAERQRQRRIAEEARREEDRLRAEQRQREEAAEAAKRRDHKATHEAAASDKAREADRAGATAAFAETTAAAKPAALARTRSTAGALSTLQTVWLHTVTDWDAIPLDKLRPYIKRELIDAAIKKLIASGVRELPGVTIYEDTKAQTR